jgi:GNAT superfamily N-acetyltransferase
VTHTLEQVLIRRYEDADELAVLDLLKTTLGGGPTGDRTAEFFRWKHRDSVFGPSFMLVAEADGAIVGLRAFMRWNFRSSGTLLRGVTAVDTATHPEHQGRGIFSALTRRALDDLSSEIDFVFNTPNEKSLPGYLKMGWRRLGRVPVHLRIKSPQGFVRALASRGRVGTRPPAAEAEPVAAFMDELAASTLLEDAAVGGCIATDRTLEYLRWRYVDAPALDYRGVAVNTAGRLEGFGIFRVRPRAGAWEATVTELIVRPGDARAGRKVLRDIGRSARVDHLTCHFPPRSTAARAAMACGYLRSPRGITFVVNPLGHSIHPDPTELSSWALTLGDLEVF